MSHAPKCRHKSYGLKTVERKGKDESEYQCSFVGQTGMWMMEILEYWSEWLYFNVMVSS